MKKCYLLVSLVKLSALFPSVLLYLCGCSIFSYSCVFLIFVLFLPCSFLLSLILPCECVFGSQKVGFWSYCILKLASFCVLSFYFATLALLFCVFNTVTVAAWTPPLVVLFGIWQIVFGSDVWIFVALFSRGMDWEIF